ncbi:MAG: hypothetical protein MZV64_04570 [Ignavibacteriales bacterium]|nr:hypothetical protein [Ignavibacteriales bacterium]
MMVRKSRGPRHPRGVRAARCRGHEEVGSAAAGGRDRLIRRRQRAALQSQIRLLHRKPAIEQFGGAGLAADEPYGAGRAGWPEPDERAEGSRAPRVAVEQARIAPARGEGRNPTPSRGGFPACGVRLGRRRARSALRRSRIAVFCLA